MLNSLALGAKTLWVAVDSPEKLDGLSAGLSWGDSLGELRKKGQNWQFVEPKEGTTGWLDYILISSTLKGPKKKLAHMWLDHILSPDFQAGHVVKSLGNDPVTNNLKPHLTKEEIVQHHLDSPNYFKDNRSLWPTLEARVLNAYKLMWDRALEHRAKQKKKAH